MNPNQEASQVGAAAAAESKPVSKSKRDNWEPIIHAWQESGLSQSAFCRNNDLKLSRFIYWRAKILGKADVEFRSSVGKSAVSPFVPVQTVQTSSDSGLRVSLPNGIILSGIDEKNVVLLKTIIQAL